MKVFTQIGLGIGLAILIALVLWQGVADILHLLAASGWVLLVLPLAWLPSLLPLTEAWRQLFATEQRPAFGRALGAIWMARAVNNLLPVANIGGEVVKARLAWMWGCRGTSAAASVIVDKTVQVIAIIVWGLAGVLCLLAVDPENRIGQLALIGFAVLAVAIIAFLVVQRAGMFAFLAHIGESMLKIESLDGVSVGARELDVEVLETYRRRRGFVRALFLKPFGLAMQTAEVWLACLLLGHPIGLIESAMLKSLTSTLSDVAFVIPNAYGIQEGAFIVVGALVGLDAEVALALSLSLRIRDVLLDPPGLLVLHRIETHRWFGRPDSGSESKPPVQGQSQNRGF
jgi:putative membrane protein